MDTKIFTRKEVAQKFDVNVNTLRNWERSGQIEPPKRIGRRVYWTDDQISRTLACSSATQATN